ncbi:MAG: ATP-binding protein [Candidatus Aenigmarchaeota archaeon]|nr:ATP-binding protein [Candidatus Aenigmarchaeota archaeon]
MDIKQLIALVSTKEGYNLEFKEKLDKSIAKEICAFANASGGKIILGVSDLEEIKGFNLTNSNMSQIQDIARNMDPSFSVHIEQVGNLAVVYVPEGKDKPYFVSGHCHLRIGANSQQLKRNEIKEFFHLK